MIREDIQFFYRTSKPKQLNNLEIDVGRRSFSDYLSESDKFRIEEVWKREVLSLNPGAFSTPNGLATLFDTTNEVYSFHKTQFKDYVSISRTSEKRELSPETYENMRVAAVGAFLEMGDESIFIHRRSLKATHAAGAYDSSCAGLCLVENGKINPEKSLLEKAQRELGLNIEEVIVSGLVGVHSSYAPDFSCLFDISLKTSLLPEQLRERIKENTFPEYRFVKKSDLTDFIVENYARKNDMLGDGTATLMGALDDEASEYVVKNIRSSGKKIEFGTLVQGKFVNWF